MLSCRQSIGHWSPLEPLAKESKSVPYVRCYARPPRTEICARDQGAQFTSLDFTGRLASVGIHISMDGRGRALDNVFVERLWRTVKYEEVYVKDYETPREAIQGLGTFFVRYNELRQHQSLEYQTPAAVYFSSSV
jgi:putative transposase